LRWRNALVVFKLDALLLYEVDEPVKMRSGFAGDCGGCGKIGSISLCNILSRDLRPARLANMLHRVAGMDASIAVHGFLDCYDDLPCEAKFG
jgi:hypothetical protein